MRVIVFGTGGREHALVKALSSAGTVTEVHAVPGSDGMAEIALCHSVDPMDFEKLGPLLDRFSFDLAVVGPEAYLDKGLVDFLKTKSVPCVGPKQMSARLESSKIFAKKFMVESGVPTAAFFEVDSLEATLRAAQNFSPPYVLKLDGLASGKGVFICKDMNELSLQADLVFNKKAFGAAGKSALLEEFQKGYELSALVLTNGKQFEILPLMQDHKRLKDGNEGPNTGGMGVVGPLKISEELYAQLKNRVVAPSVSGLERMGLDFKGVLFIGVMMTESGPSVLEYNVRFGDPEAQGILPLLEGDWGKVFCDLARGEVQTLKWKPLYSACVVMAAPGYPDHPRKDVRIQGPLDHQTPNSYFLHAGTKYKDKTWVTNGGRVLNAVATGLSQEEALEKAYLQAEKVTWEGMQMRSDIGEGLGPASELF